MKAKKNKNGEYTLYEVTGKDIFTLREELNRILEEAEKAGFVIKGTWPGEEVMERYVVRAESV